METFNSTAVSPPGESERFVEMRFKPGPSASVGEIDASRLMLLEKLLMLDTVMLRMTEDSVDRLRLPGLVETVKPSPRTMIVAGMLIEPLVPVTVTA